MDDTASLFLGMLFSSLGVGYCIYGKKQAKLPPLISGIALVIYPYFIPNAIAVTLVGIALLLVPYFWRS